MVSFNNREIATALWLLIFLALVLLKADIRKSFMSVLRSFFRLKILVPVILMILYTAAAVILLAAIDMWNVSLLKDSIVWFCVIAMAMMIRFVTSDNVENIFQRILTDSIKIVIILEFLINTYTFSLPAALVILPLLTFIAMFDVVASHDKKYSMVAKLVERVQNVIYLLIIVIVLWRAIHDLHNLQTLDTVRSVALAPLLSLLFSPFLYVMVLASKYELVFLRLDLGMAKERGLKCYARFRILMYVGLSLRKLQHLLRNNTADLMHIQTKADVDRLVQQNNSPRGA
jgi:hypothetical protein